PVALYPFIPMAARGDSKFGFYSFSPIAGKVWPPVAYGGSRSRRIYVHTTCKSYPDTKDGFNAGVRFTLGKPAVCSNSAWRHSRSNHRHDSDPSFFRNVETGL